MAGQGDAQVRGGKDAPCDLEAHPVGSALRSAVLRTFLELAAPAFQNNEAATHMATILAQHSDALENVIFRADLGTNSQNSMRHPVTLYWPRLRGKRIDARSNMFPDRALIASRQPPLHVRLRVARLRYALRVGPCAPPVKAIIVYYADNPRVGPAGCCSRWINVAASNVTIQHHTPFACRYLKTILLKPGYSFKEKTF